MTRRWPEPLTPDAVVAVVAPSGPYDPARLQRGIDELTSWGLEVRAPVPLRHPTLPYLAGTDAERAAEFTAAWTDPDVRAVWAARGGYGAQRTVDLIDLDALRAAGPKHLVGYSDITALHARIGRELGQVTVHGAAAAGADQWDDADTTTSVRRLVTAPPESGLLLARGEQREGGPAAGRLVGGNLALVAADLGIEPVSDEPCIAVLEDVGETDYRIDRMLTQLLRAGWFAQVTGIVLGDFTDCGPAERIDAVLTDRLSGLGVPVLTGIPFGHGASNIALPLGAQVSMPGDGTLVLSALRTA